MSKKNYSGNILARTMKHADRLVEAIDRRTRTGKYNEEDNNKSLNCQVSRDGARCWTF